MSISINNLSVRVDEKEIIHDISLEIKPGEVHVIMGPNGSGKSTLANTLAGHPKYTIEKGSIVLDEQDITNAPAHERAKAGLFLSMQYAPQIEGVSVANFLRLAIGAVTGEKKNPVKLHAEIVKKMNDFGMDPEFLKRHLNVGFSGGEKKRLDILQLLLLNPKYAILDETDSGLDVDALKVVANGIAHFKTEAKGIIIITHYNHILEYIVPDMVHVMIDGKIVKSGGKELAKEIETEGYSSYINK